MDAKTLTAFEDDDLDDILDAKPTALATLPARRTGMSPPNPLDPSLLGFPPMLPVELAMKTDTVPAICAAYGITRDQLARIIEDPIFIVAFNNATEMLQKDGASFKLKTKMQAEALLPKVWELVHSQYTPYAVKADLIKSVVRWAEYEPKKDAAGGTGGMFNIQINLT
jgi:hypothetical protein